MIMTISGRIASIGTGKYTTEGTPVIDFQLAVDRGNVKKRVSMLNGKEYDADFYKVSLFGQTALSFAQFAQVGRNVDVSGRFLQEEFVSKNQTVQIATDNPLYGYFKSLIGQVPQEVLSNDAEGNLYIKGNHSVSRVGITALECRWKDKNPNNQGGFNQGGFNQGGGFNPNQANQGFGTQANTGFGGQPQGGFGQPQGGFAPQPQGGFNQQPQGGFAPQPNANAGFGVQAPQNNPNAGFGVQTQQINGGFAPAPQMSNGGFAPAPQANNGFGTQTQSNQDGTMGSFTGQQNPTGSAGFPGFGGATQQPVGFNSNQGFTAPINPQAGNSSGFSTPTNETVVDNSTASTTNESSVETNIPVPPANENSETKEPEGNQGF